MANPRGESEANALRRDFDHHLMLDFGESFGFTARAGETLADIRADNSGPHLPGGCGTRQGRPAGYGM
jgi:hypothetical protein